MRGQNFSRSFRLLILAGALYQPSQLFSGEQLRASESPNQKSSVSIERVDNGDLRMLFKDRANPAGIDLSSKSLFGNFLDAHEPIPEIRWSPSSEFFVLEKKSADGVSGKIVSFDELKSNARVSDLKIPFAGESEVVSYVFTNENGIRVTQRLANGRVATGLMTIEPSGAVHGVIGK